MSFRLKTVLGIALIEAALLLILVMSSLYELRGTGEEQLRQRAQTTASLFASTTADAVLAYDLASLESQVAEVMSNPGLVYARVRSNGEVLAESGSDGALGGIFVDDADLDAVTDGVFDRSAPIMVGGENYGRVEIGLDIAHMQRELSRATRTFSSIAASELLLSGLFSFVLGTLLTRQLKSLKDGTRAVAEGRFGYQVDVKGKDEIAQAVGAFNAMSSDLATLMDENAEQRDELRSATELLSGLVDNLQSGVLLVDMRGVVLHANRGFSELLGSDASPSMLIGRPYSKVEEMLVGRLDNPGSAKQRFNTYVDQAERTTDQLFMLKCGSVIETDYTPLFCDGRQYAHLWNHRDVTERIQAQKQVNERQRELNTVFELSPDGFVHFDCDDEITSVNPAFTQITGISEQKACGVRRGRFFAMLRTECGVSDIEDAGGHRLVKITYPKPRIISCRERSLGNRGEGAHVMYLRDITHERELDEMKSDFLATAAHELRTPLANVYGFSELLLQFEHGPDERHEMINTIYRQSAHLVSMLNELLDLARIEARSGKDFEIRRQPLLPLLRDSVNSFLPEGDDRRVNVQFPDILPAVPVDGAKLKQVLSNVLSNAFKYSPGGGDVSVVAEQLDGAIEIHIVDQGIGMSPDQVEAMFDRFYRADKSGAIPGSGLGMSLVKEIVNIHGWEVIVDSQLDVGTSVTIRVPLDSSNDQRLHKVG